jgi:hypothetical protein
MHRMRRHQRLFSRISLLAITALLWSQMLLALHADCEWSAKASTQADTVAEHSDCTDQGDGTDLAVCKAHCNQGDASSDHSRAPLVPFLGLVAPVSVDTVRRLAAQGTIAPSPRRQAGWHRPTQHPASVLLI